jgi:hypothetical protein
MRNISDTFVDKSKHILCSTTFFFFFFFENRIIYEIICKTIVEPGKTEMATLHTRVACWMPKATNTRSEYLLLIVFPQQIVARVGLNVVL